MRLKDIEIGHTYMAQIPPRLDRVIAEQVDHGEIIVTVEEVGVTYEVETYEASMVWGAGFTRRHKSDRADGVRVRWEQQERPWRFGRYGEQTTVWAGEGVVQGRRLRELYEWEKG